MMQMTFREVPISRLGVSDHNVRRTPSGEDGLAELAASIRTHGLLCPLIVTAGVTEGDAAPLAVLGGSRRLAALRRLVDAGDLDGEATVPCVLVPNGRDDVSDLELSLAENTGREDLHPVDQASAFRALRDCNGLTDRELAIRFGVSPRTVQRRLRMSRAAPELMERCRRGELPLGVVEAATVSPDHALQLRAVEATEGEEWGRERMIRERLTVEKVPADSRFARCVGLDAYRGAGGTVSVDVMDDHKNPRTWLDDARLLERLVVEKLERAAAADREAGWTTVEVAPEQPRGWWDTHTHLYDCQTPSDLPKDVDPGGVVRHLFVRHDGGIDNLTLAPDPPDAPADPGGNGSDETDAGSNGLPASLRVDLHTHRLSIERDALGHGPVTLARDLLLSTLVDQLFGRRGSGALDLRCGSHKAAAQEMAPQRVPPCVAVADDRLARLGDALLGAWYDCENDEDRWRILCGMAEDDKQRLLACCVARMLESPPARATTQPAAASGAALGELEIDWAETYDPGTAVLQRLTKNQLHRIARENLPCEDLDLRDLGGLSKKEMVAKVAEAFASFRAREGRSPWVPEEISSTGEGRDA